MMTTSKVDLLLRLPKTAAENQICTDYATIIIMTIIMNYTYSMISKLLLCWLSEQLHSSVQRKFIKGFVVKEVKTIGAKVE